jgi:hypothetical protein
MSEKTNLLHYLALIGTIEDDMWIIDSGSLSVTHDFGHHDDVLMMVYSGSYGHQVDLGRSVCVRTYGFIQ